MQNNQEFNSSSWEIPMFTTSFWTGKKSDFCVVIPVINEGERIKNLLARMQQLKISQIADLIIVDGGSSDGSLDPTFLKAFGVSGLLVKTGPGKLSAQLRCAYSFTLKNEYLGIVTIDGNNKDEPSAIPKFIDALKSGYDFIQASRFIPGGIAINTPALRNLAIRLIHAPLLSITSGFKWTDTTQGFRGYSRKMLLDTKINIFRNIFDTYELLAYLSYRVPKLKYKCLELATARIYPTGEVPTKISSIRGNFSVLTILFKTCLGHYNPTD